MITRRITRSMSVPAATIRAMPGDPGRLPAPVSAAAPGAVRAAVAGELLGRVRAELPAVGGLGEREQVLVAAWLTGRRALTRRPRRQRRGRAGRGWPRGPSPEAIPAWIAEGRRRRAVADQPPFSGGLHGGGLNRAVADTARSRGGVRFAPLVHRFSLYRVISSGERGGGTAQGEGACTLMPSHERVTQ